MVGQVYDLMQEGRNYIPNALELNISFVSSHWFDRKKHSAVQNVI